MGCGYGWVIGLLDSDAHSRSFVERKEGQVHQSFLGWVGGEPARRVKGKGRGVDGGVVEGIAGRHADVSLKRGSEDEQFYMKGRGRLAPAGMVHSLY